MIADDCSTQPRLTLSWKLSVLLPQTQMENTQRRGFLSLMTSDSDLVGLGQGQGSAPLMEV